MSTKNKKNYSGRNSSWTRKDNTNVGTVTTTNLAKTFTPEKPMRTSDVAREFPKVWNDIPRELASSIGKGMAKIGCKCLKPNAEIVLDLYEEMMIKHVLNM